MTQYHLRRKDKALTDPEAIDAIMKSEKFAVLGMCFNNEPYVVTLNYGYDPENKCLYFHCAQDGQKISFLNQNPFVCATIIRDLGYLDGQCDHAFASLIIRGQITLVRNISEKKHGLNVMIEHLEKTPQTIYNTLLKDDRVFDEVNILRLDIQDITAKQGNC